MRTHSTLRHACLGGQWLGGLATYGALVAAIVGITGCGDDTKPGPAALVSGSATIGPAGGTVTAGDVKVDVPAGALAANVEIKINETRDAPPPAFDVSTRIVRFEPHGTAFAAPVTVSFARPASGRPRIYWSRGYKSPYLPLVTRVEGERVVAKVDHFSFGAILGFRAAEVLAAIEPVSCPPEV